MRRLFMEPIGIFILAMVCQLYSCAQNVSDSVEQMSYASVAGEEYLEGDKIETNLNNKVFFDFDKSSLDASDKSLLEQYLPSPLSPEEIDELVKAAITECNASARADMGRVMKVLQEKTAGRADGKALSQAVMKQLA